MRRSLRTRWRARARVATTSLAVGAIAVGGAAVGVPGLDTALRAVVSPVGQERPAHRAAQRATVAVVPEPGPTAPTSSRTTAPSPTPATRRTPAPPPLPPGPASRAAASAEAEARRLAAADGAAPDPAPDPAHSAVPGERNVPAATFRVASFNTLGASHTGPGSARPQYADGRTRTPWAVRLLSEAGVSVAGLQELQPPQVAVFEQVATGWEAWPGAGRLGGVNSLVWRADTWQPVGTHTLDVPYFGGHAVPMPYVLLRHAETGQEVWFANFHNPADAHGPAQRWRDEAVRREAELVARLHADGTPVVVTGDFNDRAGFLCPLAAGAGVVSADGSGLTGTGCSLAKGAGVDWVVGTADDVAFSDFHRVHDGLVSRTSDHPLVWSEATVGSPG